MSKIRWDNKNRLSKKQKTALGMVIASCLSLLTSPVAQGAGVVIGDGSSGTSTPITAVGKVGFVAIGDYSTSGGNQSIAIGGKNGTIGGASSTADQAIAIGANTTADKVGSIALGSYSVTTADKGVMGYNPITSLDKVMLATASTAEINTWKSTHAALAIGDGTTVTRQITGLAAGANDTDAVNVAQLKATETHYFSVTGSGSKTDDNYKNTGAQGYNAIAIGRNATAGSLGKGYSVAVGYGATASDSATALGTGAKATGTNSIALSGQGKMYNASGGLTADYGSEAKGDGSIAFGNMAIADGKTGIAIGRQSSTGTAAHGAIAMGQFATASAEQSIAIGGTNAGYAAKAPTNITKATALRAVAIGANAQATKDDSIALGSGSVTTADKGVTGYDPRTATTSTATSSAWKSTHAALAIGNGGW